MKIQKILEELATSRSLRGNVDRNVMELQHGLRGRVVPYVGTWIEILTGKDMNELDFGSFPTWERG